VLELQQLIFRAVAIANSMKLKDAFEAGKIAPANRDWVAAFLTGSSAELSAASIRKADASRAGDNIIPCKFQTKSR
jgi:hypothetical protein